MSLRTMFWGNGTTPTPTPPSGDSTPTYVGFICAVVAVVLYGSNFVPVKKYDTGNGIFFQWILCSGIFLSGLVLQMVHNTPVYILPMLGGVIWATGNLCVVPVIKTIGMGLGLSIWGTSALCIGWAIGRFGLFKTKTAEITHYVMNDFSVILAVISIFILVLVKNEVSSSNSDTSEIDENKPLISTNGDMEDKGGSLQEPTEEGTMFWERLPELQKRIIGTVLSVFSGLMYGVNFTPTEYVQNNYDGASKKGLDYVFAQFCGIYLASSVFMVIYCLYKKNKPQVYPQVIVPGLVSGILWAVATACWNVANSTLSQAISFPIVATGPCGLASLFWGVFIFGEIRGRKNIAILVLGFLVNLTGSILAGLSK